MRLDSITKGTHLHYSLSERYQRACGDGAGAVRWLTEHQFGVEFIRLGLEEQERLRAYAHELQTED